MNLEQFFWQWERYAPQADSLMTRERAARLLRSWRKARIQGRRVFALTREASQGRRTYRVTHNASGERAALIIAAIKESAQ